MLRRESILYFVVVASNQTKRHQTVLTIGDAAYLLLLVVYRLRQMVRNRLSATAVYMTVFEMFL